MLQAKLDKEAAAGTLALEGEVAVPQEGMGNEASPGVAEACEEIRNGRPLRLPRSILRGVGADRSPLVAITADQVRNPAPIEIGTQVSIQIGVIPQSEGRRVRFERSTALALAGIFAESN